MRAFFGRLIAVAALAFSLQAHAQGAIQQSGAIVPFHAPSFFRNGVVGDAGTPAAPYLNDIGLFNGAACPFGVSSQTSPGVSLTPYSIFTVCQTNAATTLNFLGVNGEPTPSVLFNIGGTSYPFPGPGNGNVIGPLSSTVGHLACFNSTTGTILSDCGTGFPIPQSDGGSGATTLGAGVVTATHGLTARSLADHFSDTVFLKDYGALCDGAHAAADTAAFVAVYTQFMVNSDSRGMHLILPPGECDVSQTMAAVPFDQLIDLWISGQGITLTTVNFASAPANSDGFTFGAGAQFGISDMTIASAPRDCISINPGQSVGSAAATLYRFINIRVQFCGRDGKREVNSFLGTVEDSWFLSNGGNGENYLGGHTTMTHSRVYDEGNVLSGTAINGMVSSTWISGAGDRNKWAVSISNINGVNFINYYGEQNTQSMFLLFTNTASETGLPSSYTGINALSIQNPFGYDNSFGSPGSFDGLLFAQTANAVPMAGITLSGCTYIDDQGGSPVAIQFNAASGAITATAIACKPPLGVVISNGATFSPMDIGSSTFANLPTNPFVGFRAYITDNNSACTFGTTATGSGATACPVFYAGSGVWKAG